MKVKFDIFEMTFLGYDKENDMPIIKERFKETKVGEVVGNYVGKTGLYESNMEVPYFIILLDDGSFTSMPISKCTLVKDKENKQ